MTRLLAQVDCSSRHPRRRRTPGERLVRLGLAEPTARDARRAAWTRWTGAGQSSARKTPPTTEMSQLPGALVSRSART
jgi:hypothetical protein